MIVEGIAMWAAIQAPNTTYTPEYSIDLVVDDKTSKELAKLGLNGKKKEEGMTYKFKRPLINKKSGENNPKPVVRDAANEDFTGLVGNGSKVKVQFSTYEWSNKFGHGVSADLQGVQVLELVSFKPGDGDEFEEEGEPQQPKKPATEPEMEFDDELPDVL